MKLPKRKTFWEVLRRIERYQSIDRINIFALDAPKENEVLIQMGFHEALELRDALTQMLEGDLVEWYKSRKDCGCFEIERVLKE